MAPPAYSMSPPQAGYLRSNHGFPPLPPPPHFLYRNLRGAGIGWPPIPPIPRIPRAQNPIIRPKKIICIRDPLTLQDVTEEILSSANSSLATKRSQSIPQMTPPAVKPNSRRVPQVPVAPALTLPLGFVRKPPTPPQVILKCFEDEYRLWHNDESSDSSTWNRGRDIFQDGVGGCSWPPTNVPWFKGAWGHKGISTFAGAGEAGKKQYSREVLMALRYNALSLIEPKELEKWDMIKVKEHQPRATSLSESEETKSPKVSVASQSKKPELPNKTGKANKSGATKSNGGSTETNVATIKSPKTKKKNSNGKKESIKSASSSNDSSMTKDSSTKEANKVNGKLDRGDFSFEEPTAEE